MSLRISMTVMVQCVMAENCVAATKLVILFFSTVIGPHGWVSLFSGGLPDLKLEELCPLDKMCFNNSINQAINQASKQSSNQSLFVQR